jgi:hypothetical protein
MDAKSLALLVSILTVFTTHALPIRAAESTKPAAQADDRIVIYRCTDAQGRLSLSDSPCRRGERQDVRNMARPKDAKRASSASMARDTASVVSTPQVVILQQASRPLYECSGRDESGRLQTYLNDSPEGKLRWVPSPPVLLVPQPLYGSNQAVVQVSEYGHSRQPILYSNGNWVRDSCFTLPPTEACSRLRDERTELGRRRFNAQQTERMQIDREERSVEARLAQECR